MSEKIPKYYIESLLDSSGVVAETYHHRIGKIGMGWRITDGKYTSGYSNDARLIKRLQMLELLFELLLQGDCLYNLDRLHDEGYLDNLSDEDFRLLSATYRQLTSE